jgi:hypothetical protein
MFSQVCLANAFLFKTSFILFICLYFILRKDTKPYLVFELIAEDLYIGISLV